MCYRVWNARVHRGEETEGYIENYGALQRPSRDSTVLLQDDRHAGPRLVVIFIYYFILKK